MRQRMHFLISDGSQRRDHHVEAVKPWPAFDEVISGGANCHDQQQKNADLSQMAEGVHDSRWSSVVGRQPLVVGQEHVPAAAWTSQRPPTSDDPLGPTTIKQNGPPRSAEGR